MLVNKLLLALVLALIILCASLKVTNVRQAKYIGQLDTFTREVIQVCKQIDSKYQQCATNCKTI